MQKKSLRSGFTLVELLVVIAIIGILVALLLPAVQAAREAARRTQCKNNLKQIGLALHNYHDTQKSFPPGTVWGTGARYSNPRTGGYIMHIFPYLEQSNVYDKIDFSVSGILWYYGNNKAMTSATVETLLCPSDGEGGTHAIDPTQGPIMKSNYLGFYSGYQQGDIFTTDPNKRAVFGGNRGASLADITDGTSNTMIVGEFLTGASSSEFRGFAFSDQANGAQLYTEFGPNSSSPDRCCNMTSWCSNRPNQNLPAVAGNCSTTDTAGSRSRHTGGVQVLLADGSIHFISDSIDLTLWRHLATIAGGEVVANF